MSFTPCVYPLIPVIVGYIGIKSGQTRKRRAFALSFTYVSGMAITYAALGLIASLTGSIFGLISTHPITYILVGSIIISFGLAMFGVFRLPLPQINHKQHHKEHNYLSIFLLGLTSGFVVTPCTVPVLGTILLFLATEKNVFYGTTLLLSFAYGIGFILILAGTFSSFLMNIPKSGRWLLYLQKIFSLLLVAMGIYFILKGIGRM